MPRRRLTPNGVDHPPQDRPADRIRWARDIVGLSRDELAVLAGVDRKTLMRLENPKASPNVDLTTMMRLAYALGLAPSELWPGLHVRPPKPMRLAHDAVYEALALGLIAVRSSRVNVVESRRPPPDLCSTAMRPLTAKPDPLWDAIADGDISDA